MTTEQEVKEMLDFLKTSMPVMEQSWILLNQELKEIKAIAQQNNRSLRGSNNDAGLVAAVAHLRLKQDQACAAVADLDKLLHKGTDRVPGLMERVRILERFQKTLKYWAALLIGATLVNIIAVLIQLASRSLIPGG